MKDESVSNILQFWRAVEYTTIQEPPHRNEFHNQSTFYTKINSETKLPWQNKRFSSTQNYTWRHEIYLGIFGAKEAYKIILDRFGATEDDLERIRRTKNKKSVFCAFTLDEEGKNINASVPASLPWSIGQLIRGEKLNTFSQYEFLFQEILYPWTDGEKVQEPILHSDLEFILREIRELSKCLIQDVELGICISRKISRANAEAGTRKNHGTNLLNSLIARDLLYVEHQFSKGVGKAFRQYFMMGDSEPKVDSKR